MRVDERLVPLMLLVILHLNDVRERERPILLRHSLKGGGVRVALPGERALRLGNSILSGEGRLSLGDRFCG